MYRDLLLGRTRKSHPLIFNARSKHRNFFFIFTRRMKSSSRSLAFILDLVQNALVHWRLVVLQAFLGIQHASDQSVLAAILHVPLDLEIARERVEVVGGVIVASREGNTLYSGRLRSNPLIKASANSRV